jgi:DNA polymerase III subunit gamma/tau
MEKIKHKVLALKYRPKNFNELIGQDIMVETITNSIKTNKVPNAYLFTGIRGVGKTTTARIVAKSLNCKNGVTNLCADDMCEHCRGITNSNHLDVLEMDAASRTGIDDVRELIESSKYNPTSAKYKIIILDEVHMLSKQAFNGLLKTLEEPPPHLKFIFATTEVKKIPVTIISRCQRFDLHRVTIKDLMENLKKILKNENKTITDKALALIAKAAEGSVRDSLSLLDRALVSQNIDNKEIDETFIRTMLGIADRSKILDLLSFILDGDQTKSLEILRQMIDQGIEPEDFLNDFLEIIYFMLQKKSLENFKNELSISESEIATINKISSNVEISTLIIFWQFVVKGIDELSVISNPVLSIEMLIMKLLHLKEMPSYESILNSLNKSDIKIEENINDDKKKNNEIEKNFTDTPPVSQSSKDQIKITSQKKPDLVSPEPKILSKNKTEEKISTFEDLIKLSSKKREIELKYDLERNVNLIKFSEGKIDISLNENLGKNFVRNLSEKLLDWTGKRWVITLTKAVGEQTYSENQSLIKKNLLEDEKKSEIFKKFKDTFSDAELIEISKKE